MNEAKQQFKRGLIWLGSAAAIGRIADAVSMFAVLFFLSKEEIGVATIAWAIGMVLEAIRTLGLGVAILQAKDVSREQLDSSFWMMMFVAVALGVLAVGGGPLVGPFLQEPELGILLIPGAVKLFFLNWAEIPTQQMNRKLQFASLAGVQTSATILAAISRVALAATGFGAWALLIAHALHGVFIWLATMIVQPFWPRLSFQFFRIREFLHFGKYVSGDWLTRELFRNADYLVLGGVAGPAVVGVYRVAFDIATMPAIAFGDVLNRTALPVMARLQGEERAELFVNATSKLAVLMGALCALTIVTATDITALFQNGEYAAAAGPTQILAVVAAFRVLFQLFPELFNASGSPLITFRFGLLSLVVLAGCFASALFAIGPDRADIAVAVGWLGVYPVLLPLALMTGARNMSLQPAQYGLALVAPAVAAGLAAGVGLWSYPFIAAPFAWWGMRVGIMFGVTFAVYLMAFLLAGRLLEMLKGPARTA